MNAQELKESLSPFLENEQSGITLYAVLKNDQHDVIRKLDIDANALPQLKTMFLNEIREQIVEKDELAVIQLSDADERGNVIYEYDLELPVELQSLQTVKGTDGVELLSLNDSSLSDIKALVIEIGDNTDQITLYKTMAPVNIFKRGFFLKKSRHRLTRIRDEFLRVSSGFQILQVQDSVFILDLKTLEMQFGFHEVIRREAGVSIDIIEGCNLVDNPQTLRDAIEDIRFARKLTKIARSSPVLEQGIGRGAIATFCQTHPSLSGKIKVSETNGKLTLDTKVARNLFVKLLMDDFLVSELTELYYDSLAKDRAEVVE